MIVENLKKAEEIVNEITTKCYDSHRELITIANKAHLAHVKRAINLRVGVPIGILSVLLMWLITTNYSVGVSTAAHRANIEQIIETQTLTIAEIKAEIIRLDAEIKANFKWLIDNGNFKWLIDNGNFKSREKIHYNLND